MTVIIDGTKGTTTPGLYSNSTFTGTYTDGIVVDYTTGTGRISVGSSDGLTIYNGGVASTSLLEITSGGNVGISITPSAWNAAVRALEIVGYTSVYGDSGYFGAAGLSRNAYWGVGSGTSWVYRGTATALRYEQGGSAGVGIHAWYNADSGTGGTPISWTQTLGVGKGTTLTLQGGSSSSGTGIAFPASQSASSDANTLDDYEEGAWTPSFSASGPPTVTYSIQQGTYVKIGRMVHCGVRITINTVSGGSGGNLWLAGLPFTADSSNGNCWSGVIGWNAGSFNTQQPFGFEVAGGQTFAYVHYISSSGTTVDMNPTMLKAGALIEASFSYMASA